VRDGTIVEIREDRSELRGAHDFAGCAIFPGTVNTHTHAFHSMLRGCGDDLPLLKWLHEVVYKHAAEFTPDDAYVAAALAFGEMLKNGITTVVDFFYLNGRGNEYAFSNYQGGRGSASDRRDVAEEIEVALIFCRPWSLSDAVLAQPLSRPRDYPEVVRSYQR
jgi:cytosine/adenosine deaminase-related metal-dependent hydrolase